MRNARVARTMLLSLGALTVAVGGLISSAAVADDKQVSIAFVSGPLNDSFFPPLYQGAQDAAKALAVKLNYVPIDEADIEVTSLDTASDLGIVALPIGMLMIGGEFDLSVGSVVGASSGGGAIGCASFAQARSLIPRVITFDRRWPSLALRWRRWFRAWR